MNEENNLNFENGGAIKNNKSVVKNNDSKIIFTIVISVVAICLITFGVYIYKLSFADISKFNGGNVTREEYKIYYKLFMPMLEMYGYPKELIPNEIAKKASLDKIVLMLAKNENMTLTDEEKAKIDESFKDEKHVEQMKKNKIDLEKLRNVYENDTLIQKYIEKMKNELSKEDVRNYLVKNYGNDVDLKEYVTRNLLIATSESVTKEQAKTKAINVINRLNKGEKFENLVKELSDDEGTKEKGGLYSVYMNEATVKEYKDATLKLEVGKYTLEPVETKFGYHVIYLEKVNEEGRLSLDSEKDPALNYKIEELNTKYNVKIDEKVLKSYANYLNAEIQKIQEEIMKEQEVDVYDKK